MVMPNRSDGAGSSGWWDDLPPRIRNRFSGPPRLEQTPAEPDQTRPNHLIRDLSGLAGLFLAVAVANLLFLLIAMSFLASHTPTAP